jgi:hypothetical protein
VLSGDFTPAAGATPAACSGTTVVVGADGTATIHVAPEAALALHVAAKL